MTGIRWSQQTKLAAAVDALSGWQQNAAAVGVLVTQVNLTLLDDPAQPGLGGAMVVFEWDPEHSEYVMRTAGE